MLFFISRLGNRQGIQTLQFESITRSFLGRIHIISQRQNQFQNFLQFGRISQTFGSHGNRINLGFDHLDNLKILKKMKNRTKIGNWINRKIENWTKIGQKLIYQQNRKIQN